MSDDLILGVRDAWGEETPFRLSRPDRTQHLYVIGKSGTGKTTLLRNLIIQDIEAGRGVAIIDPHGDLATDLLDHIPRRRIEDVVYFDPSDEENAVGFNLLARVPTYTSPAMEVEVRRTMHIVNIFWRPRNPIVDEIRTTVTALMIEIDHVPDRDDLALSRIPQITGARGSVRLELKEGYSFLFRFLFEGPNPGNPIDLPPEAGGLKRENRIG